MRVFPFLLACLIAFPAAAETFEKAERIARKQGKRALKQSAAGLSENDLRNYVTRLASAQYEGRGTGDKGERMATSYLATFFRGLGLAPEGTATSFFHTFDFAAGMRMEGTNNLSFAGKIPRLQKYHYARKRLPTSFDLNLGRDRSRSRVRWLWYSRGKL